MRDFAHLLERLAFTPQRNGKLRLLSRYFGATADPERGLALAALTGDLKLRAVTPSMLRGLVTERVDEQLFAASYDFVGDLAETIALIWPEPETPPNDSDLPLPMLVEELQITGKAGLPSLIASRLDALNPSGRYAYLKLATGGLRVGVSARLARAALAEYGDLPLDGIEEIWHGLKPPYLELFQWAEGGSKPEAAAHAPFRPVMLSTATDLDALQSLDPADFAAEWKWDGIRVQAVSDQGTRRLYSRTGEDISGAFPDLLERLEFDGVIDGELLVRRGDAVGSFGDLQQRLNRKTISKKLLDSHPAGLRAYDLLIWQGEDQRARPFGQRRERLEQAVAGISDPRIDASPLLAFESWDQLAALRADPPDPVIEGIMLKRRDSPYLAGRIKGPWFKWKRDPMVIDAVLMYAQRGHGKRSGYYSDFTFGVWDGAELVPVGKAYFGFTDEELKQLDRFVRNNTVDRFGPVRAVAQEKVVEVAFEGLNRSARHKSGVAMRFPRISRIRDDKPAAEADRIETLREMLPPLLT
ncbi:cisplatin damage response ATP-dependent DNA ligase [Paracoccus aerodenitrificans]|uniref:cisplatin damage response ATP-dependent DNA ligase n=1 Tax=Paracoccus aerodenitrificans TaxID=3017781 RepID=UPI0022F02B8F|nr:cisplatin damage response ATP-dependent DNA ligase [Paracoccus aerodenitrificans]WBU64974.1 cisplatin damage response ATP-dependent DNA ligase [Paracoccus aerodenitrificans]